MTWALMRLFSLGGLFKRALTAVTSDWRYVVIAILSLFTAYNYTSANKWQARHEKAQAALSKQDKVIADIAVASEAAKQAAVANAKRVELEYKEIAYNAEITYNRAIADNRLTVERWLRKNNRGATDKINSATPTKIPTGITESEAMSKLPGGFVVLPESDLSKIVDIQATLYALQQAAREVESVSTMP
jgi:inorganic triphosphatase YgiF